MDFDGQIRRTGAALLLTCGLGAAACGGFVESGDSVARLTVGTEGGTLTLDGFALVVPPHALGGTVTLSAHRAATDAPAGPAFVVEPADVTFDVCPAMAVSGPLTGGTFGVVECPGGVCPAIVTDAGAAADAP